MGPSLWIPADASFQQRSSNAAQLDLLKAFSVPLLTCTFLEMSSEPFFIYSKNKKKILTSCTALTPGFISHPKNFRSYSIISLIMKGKRKKDFLAL